MTDGVRQLIEAYIPGDPDPTLEDNEYYYMQYTLGNPRIIRVLVLDIFPLMEGPTEYGIYQRKGGKLVWIDAGYGTRYRGVTMGDLYDNREDCMNQTHGRVYDWEQLRRIQQKGE